jgi:hypothetical protein
MKNIIRILKSKWLYYKAKQAYKKQRTAIIELRKALIIKELMQEYVVLVKEFKDAPLSTINEIKNQSLLSDKITAVSGLIKIVSQ